MLSNINTIKNIPYFGFFFIKRGSFYLLIQSFTFSYFWCYSNASLHPIDTIALFSWGKRNCIQKKSFSYLKQHSLIRIFFILLATWNHTSAMMIENYYLIIAFFVLRWIIIVYYDSISIQQVKFTIYGALWQIICHFYWIQWENGNDHRLISYLIKEA